LLVPVAAPVVRAKRPVDRVAAAGHRDRVPATVWLRADMRRRLCERDIAGVYRLLQAHGVSQRAIAARTGQSQSEVSEILAGRRQVVAYDVLVRIADGLGVPRGWMGLAYDETTVAYIRSGDRS
jgi:hypothetical protein